MVASSEGLTSSIGVGQVVDGCSGNIGSCDDVARLGTAAGASAGCDGLGSSTGVPPLDAISNFCGDVVCTTGGGKVCCSAEGGDVDWGLWRWTFHRCTGTIVSCHAEWLLLLW